MFDLFAWLCLVPPLPLLALAFAVDGPQATWQSLARGHGALETDYLNGEIALLGRLHGVATPVNQAMLALVKLRERFPSPTPTPPPLS